jgi:aminoglycoside 6'-N-acetyltransferase I
VTIREMRNSDQAIWLDMYHKFWPKFSDEALLAEIGRINRSSKRSAFVAEVDGVAVGFAEYALRDYANGCNSQPVPFLEGVWVDAQYRAQGIARALIEYLIKRAEMAGFVEFGSDVELTNYSSQLLHEKLGFEQTEKVIYYRKVLRK